LVPAPFHNRDRGAKEEIMPGCIRHQLAIAVVIVLGCITAAVALAGTSEADTCGVVGLTRSTAETVLREDVTVSPSQPTAGEAVCTITTTDKAHRTLIRVVLVAGESLAGRIEGDAYERPSEARGMRGLSSGAVLLVFVYPIHVGAHVWFEAGPFGVEVASEASYGSRTALEKTTTSAVAVAHAIYNHLGGHFTPR
jgi:hypothetical protein